MLKLTIFLNKMCFCKGNGVGEDRAVLRRVSLQPVSLHANPSCHAESTGGARKVSSIDEWVCLGWGVFLTKSCTESHQLFSQAQSMASVTDVVLADLSCTHPIDVQVEGSAAGSSSPGPWLQRVTSLISD